MRVKLSPCWSRAIFRRNAAKRSPHSMKRARTNAVLSRERFRRQTPKIRKHCSTRARKSTTRARRTNAVALLFEKGGISKKDLEASQLELTTAEDELRLQEQTVALRTRSLNPNDRALAAARTAQAQQRVATLDAQLSYATIRSPITGIVTDQFQYEGEFASAGGKLVTIADTSTVIVKAPFADTAVAQLKTGDTVTVVPTDSPLKKCTARSRCSADRAIQRIARLKFG